MGSYQRAKVAVTRKLDGKGRLILPSDLREALGIAPDETVVIEAVSLDLKTDGLFIRKAVVNDSETVKGSPV